MGCCVSAPYIFPDGGHYEGDLKNGVPVLY